MADAPADILLFGANGQVGAEAARIAATAPGLNLVALDRASCDLTQPDAAREAILSRRPAAVVNVAAYTAVDKAETERDLAFRINADAVGEMAQACAACGARFVHISTDYVFNGEADAPLPESAVVDPLNVYGETKLAGEIKTATATDDFVILRTSWVYSAFGGNFVKTMLRLGAERTALNIVGDQRGAPTPAAAIASACLSIAGSPGPTGVYHFQGAPETTWAQFAEAIFAEAKLPVAVTAITTAEYPTPAKRPLYSVLDCSAVKRDFGIEQPDWRADLGGLVQALLAETDKSSVSGKTE